jgi:double-stranded uracil-DNA glycosylase
MFQTHSFDPVYNGDSRFLILGTFPSVASRELGFYYGHPQNRFWRVLACIYKDSEPVNISEKRDFLLSHGVALWDVVQSCEITGSSDTTIRCVTPNDIGLILNTCDIRAIYANGRTAEALYRRYLLRQLSRGITALPSTSPANAAYSAGRLISCWSVILNDSVPS